MLTRSLQRIFNPGGYTGKMHGYNDSTAEYDKIILEI